jgi:hypothetical protein
VLFIYLFIYYIYIYTILLNNKKIKSLFCIIQSQNLTKCGHPLKKKKKKKKDLASNFFLFEGIH